MFGAELEGSLGHLCCVLMRWFLGVVGGKRSDGVISLGLWKISNRFSVHGTRSSFSCSNQLWENTDLWTIEKKIGIVRGVLFSQSRL